MIASLGLASVLAGLTYFFARGDARGLFVMAVAYLMAGILLQRREGQLSARSGSYYYQYAGRSSQKRVPDPAVTCSWRLRVILFWFPWLLVIRGEDVIVFCVQSVRFAWQFVVLGYDEPNSPEWKRRYRLFRTLPRLSDEAQAEMNGRGSTVSEKEFERTVIEVPATRR